MDLIQYLKGQGSIDTSSNEPEWQINSPPKNCGPLHVIIKHQKVRSIYRNNIPVLQQIEDQKREYSTTVEYFDEDEEYNQPAGFYDGNGDYFSEDDFIKWRRP